MTTSTRAPKKTRPETVGQARTWDHNASRYRSAGFCDRDAAQAAWGHQIGFSSIGPIGACCRGMVAPSFAGERAARWVAS